MSYEVLARKYRPTNFDEVIGQDHITLALNNAIKNDRISHAFTFSGPRGVGKTTTARILSRVLNNIDDSPTLFWLDAHFPGSDYQGLAYDSEKDDEKRIPLEVELKITSRFAAR